MNVSSGVWGAKNLRRKAHAPLLAVLPKTLQGYCLANAQGYSKYRAKYLLNICSHEVLPVGGLVVYSECENETVSISACRLVIVRLRAVKWRSTDQVTVYLNA